MPYEMLNFTENDERRIHFFHGFNECEELNFHIDWKLRLDAVCELHLGKDTCKYCSQIQEKYSVPRKRYCFVVYDVDNEVLGMIATMESEFSLLPALVEASDKTGKDITNKTLIIDRIGYTKDSRFYAEVTKPAKLPENLEVSNDKLKKEVIEFFSKNKK